MKQKIKACVKCRYKRRPVSQDQERDALENQFPMMAFRVLPEINLVIGICDGI